MENKTKMVEIGRKLNEYKIITDILVNFEK